LPRRWRLATIATAAFGIAATVVQYVLVLVREAVGPLRLLQVMILGCIALGFGVAAVIYIIIGIWSLVWFRKQASSPVILAITKAVTIKLFLDGVVMWVLGWSLATSWMEPLLFDTIEMAQIRSVCISLVFCSVALAFEWNGMAESNKRRKARRRIITPKDADTTPPSTASTVVTA
jgi:hypothetical protein